MSLAKMTSMRKFFEIYYKASGVGKYGLFNDDLRIETPIVTEALRRLPHAQLEARDRRTKIASELVLKHTQLPKEQWTKFEDPGHQYLTGYINEVEREEAFRLAFRGR